jgi:hypothetical protein
MAKSANERSERLAAALKENLKRRKAQARAKSGKDLPSVGAFRNESQAGLEDAPRPKSAPNRN